ncbi:MAG: hypothetical protein Q4B42_00740 [Oscillospiraceae bacterium]|nr:hypothetical protein [Oscillospiraceae bacterium]
MTQPKKVFKLTQPLESLSSLKKGRAEKPAAAEKKPEAASKTSDYANSVRLTRLSRVINAAVCAFLIILLAAAAAYACFTSYALMSLFGAAAALIPLTALLVKNLSEARAVTDIAYRGVYAARLTRAQQGEMRLNQVHQGQRFYTAAFLAVTVPETLVLIVLSRVLDSDVFLIIMAVFALAALACAMISSLYLSARLNVRHAFCTVSSRGIITSREVIPFSARDGDVSILVKFDDYYMIRYLRTEIFGLRRQAVFIFPVDGVLKNGMDVEGDAASVLAAALGLRSYKIKATEFYESRELYGTGLIKSSASV